MSREPMDLTSSDPYENKLVRDYDRKLHRAIIRVLSESSPPIDQLVSIIKQTLSQKPILSELSRWFSKLGLEHLPLLWIVVLGCYHDSAELLIRSGADVNELLYPLPSLVDGPLLLDIGRDSTRRRNERLIRLVIDHGANLEARDVHNRTALYYAVTCERVRMTEALLEKGADANNAGNEFEKELVLLAAIKSSKAHQLVPVLLKYGVNVNVKDSLYYALHYLVMAENIKSKKLLVEMCIVKGADVNVANRVGQTALHLTLESSDEAEELVPLLLKHGANVKAKDNIGMNALHYLAMGPGERVELAKLLIAQGVSLSDRETHKGSTPIDITVVYEKTELIKLFMDHGADVNGTFPPLWLAVDLDKAKALKTLLEHGANVDAKSSVDGNTALHLACKKNREEMVGILLSAGADVLVENKKGETPFALLMKNGCKFVKREKYELIKAMLRKLAVKKVDSLSMVELKDERILKTAYPRLWNYFQKCVEHINSTKSARSPTSVPVDENLITL